MKRVNGGYAFNAAMTESDIGIKEEFKVVSSDTTIRVDAIFGIDLKLRPVKPAIFRQGIFRYKRLHILSSPPAFPRKRGIHLHFLLPVLNR